MLFTELKKIKDDDIEAILAERVKARGLDPAVLQQSLAGKLTVEQLISDVVEELIGEAADANRESFRARQRKGFEQAQAGGKAVGRPSRRSDETFEQVRRMYEAHEISGAHAAQMLGVARGTFYRWLKEISENSGGGAINHIKCIKVSFYSVKSFKKVVRIFANHFFILCFLRILSAFFRFRMLRGDRFGQIFPDEITDCRTTKTKE